MKLSKNQGNEMIKVPVNFQSSWPKNNEVINVSHELTSVVLVAGVFLEHPVYYILEHPV